MKYPNGSEPVLGPFPFAQLVGVKHCPCGDGRPRLVFRVGQPIDYWSAPGYVTVKGKTVAGFITCDEDGYQFIAYPNCRNGHLLP